MNTNFIVSDMLNGKEKIFFVEYSTPVKGKFKRRVYSLVDMENGIDKAIKEYPLVNFSELKPIEIPKDSPPPEPIKQQSLLNEEKANGK